MRQRLSNGLIFAGILSLILLSLCVFGCKKEDIKPEIKDSVKVEQSTTIPIIHDSVITYNWKLDIKIPLFGIDYHNLTPTTIGNLEAQGILIGKYLEFTQDSLVFEACYSYTQGLIQATGYIANRSFILNINPSTINICGSYQHVPIIYNITY